MSADDRAKWNRIYAGRQTESAAPSPLLARWAQRLPAAGRALDVAGGAGRNAVFLAQRGLDVTVVDIASAGLRAATRRATAAGVTLTAIEADLDDEPLPPGPWDVIVDVDFLNRALFASFARELEHGGLLLFSQPTERNLERHAKPSRRFLLQPGEAAQLAATAGLEVVEHTERWRRSDRHEAWVVARRR